jgi:hypothetical protein
MAFVAKDKSLNRLNGMGPRFKGALGDAADAAGKLLVRTSQQGQAHGGKSGRLYGSHQASAPGEYSAPRTWSLHNSTRYEVSGAQFLRFGVGTHYGAFQELGTSKMGARPNARPNVRMSYEANQSTLENVFGAQLFQRLFAGG